jgi:hypothetical protein
VGLFKLFFSVVFAPLLAYLALHGLATKGIVSKEHEIHPPGLERVLALAPGSGEGYVASLGLGLPVQQFTH